MVKTRLDSFGKLDLGITGRLSDNLDVTLTTGGSLAGFFGDKNIDTVYTGLNFKFVI